MTPHATAAGQSQSSGELDIDSLLDIRHPSAPAWSRSGEQIAFIWDRGGVQNLYLVDAEGGMPRPLTEHREGTTGPPFWDLSGSAMYFERGGELFRVSTGGGAPQSVFGTDTFESGVVPSPDGTRIAFIRLGDVWVRELAGGQEHRLTVTLVTESGLVWSPGGTRIAFTFSRSTPRDEARDYVGGKLLFRRFESDSPSVGVVSVDGGDVVAIARTSASESSPRWVDERRLVLQRTSSDYRVREILVASVDGGEATVLHTDRDERWWSLAYLGAEPRPSPDGRWVAFVSDRSGRDHLYVVSTNGDGAEPSALTSGQQDVRRFSWSPDSRRIVYDTNWTHSGQRHLAIVEVGGEGPGEAPRLLTEGRGTNTQPTDASGFSLLSARGGFSSDGERLVYQHTSPETSADLYWIGLGDEDGDRVPRRLTRSLPERLDTSRFVPPENVQYSSRDGEQVPAYLFSSSELDQEQRHPAVVWIHGDGIAQNYDGWHIRRDYAVYYSFHQYLAQRGYVVLAPDYRGSVGYGRSWRVAPYRDLGGGDNEDVLASIAYLRELGYVDPERICVWGLSYGGFLTLKAMTTDPLAFRCGVDVAGVGDFGDWYRDPGGRWVGARLGRPEEDPEAYRRAAPVLDVARLSRPLLVLHGTADVNVPFLESVRLADTLLKNGKRFEFFTYPGEFHYFHREHVLRDAWQRVEEFFARHLRE
jgi:dipeptidyl aminopeptidase/acylaminoacyl peptidase